MTTINGGPDKDVLDGGDQNDVLNGLGGDDTLNGLGGNDILNGGTGNDKMTGAIGNDIYNVDSLQDQVIESAGQGTDEVRATIALTAAFANVENYTFQLSTDVNFTANDLNNRVTGGSGNDTLGGGIGNDTLDGGIGNDTLNGGTGNDALSGGTGNDKLNGGDGNDTLNGGAGDDTLTGGIGNDIYTIDSLLDQVVEKSSEGTDEIRSTVGFTTAIANVENYTFQLTTDVNFTANDLNNRVTGGSGKDTLSGGIGNDTLEGGIGDDTLNGGAGNDTLNGGTGKDTLTGEIGNDIYNVDSLQDQVVEKVSEGTDEIRSTIALTTAVANVENYTFQLTTDLNFTANDLNNTVTGGSGKDLLNGGVGNDTLNGGIGDDTLNGGAGNDTLNGGAGNDKLTGDIGNDIYNVDSLQDQVVEKASEGTDEIRSTIALTAAIANVENYKFQLSTDVTFTANDLNNVVTGGSGNDTINGGIGNDTLNGGIGDDTLNGGAGNDKLSGDTGNDIYNVDSLQDQIFENADGGADEIRATIALTSAVANVENYAFQLATPVAFTGNDLNNTVTGGTGDDNLGGAIGNDTIKGGAGNDTLSGNAGDDNLDGGDNNDTLAGGGGQDQAFGGAGNDILIIEDLAFLRADGGVGTDTLRFSGGKFNIDLAALEGGRITDIERIDLSVSGEDQLLLTQVSVQNASSSTDRLIVDAKSDDTVTLSGGFKLTGSETVGGETYDLYTLGGSTVLLDKAVTANLDSGVSVTIDLATLTAAKGFELASHMGGSQTGASVSSAGDLNGDGFDDLVIGAPVSAGSGGLDGAAFVVFGTANGPGLVQDLSTLNGSNGFRLNGPASGAMLGQAVTTAGDFNGDGIDDLLIGSKSGFTGAVRTGEAFVVFGTAVGFAASLDLSKLNGSNGFRLHGDFASGQAGYSVASAGDVNGDGYDDLVIGALGEQPNGSGSGSAYVVFGHGGAQAADIDLGALNGTTGFKISGAGGNELGRSVSAAGDVNGDGYADLLVSASGYGTPGGGAYVVFGHAGNFAATLQANAIDGTNGFILDGPFGMDVGRSVSTAGDLNGDGYDDLVVVERADDANGVAAYVLFGHGGAFTKNADLGALNGSNGFTLLDPSHAQTFNVAAAGDFNGDGYADILVSAATVSGAGSNAGGAYLIYGAAGGFASTIDVTHLSAQQGLQINGAAAGDKAWIVSAGGDVNGDGYDDIIIGAPYAQDNGSQTGLGYVIYGSNTSATASHVGTSADNTITGNASAEIFTGGLGNDTLNGAGGADTFQGGGGNDHIHVTDRTFHLVDGGSGSDTLHLDFAGVIDFGNLDANAATSDKGKIAGIEVIDATNGQANALTLHATDVLDLNVDNRDVGGVASLDNVLKIDGNAGDTLKLFSTDGWGAANGSILAGYNVYTEGAVRIAVDKDIAVTIG